MKNSINVSVEFDFKGEAYSPSLIIDLNQFLESEGSFEAVYTVLAKSNGIDTYSYLYEVMQSSNILFSDAKGLAKNYLQDGHFDLEAFRIGWHESKVLDRLRSIAIKEMGVVDLEEHSSLKNALFQAYHLGCELSEK